MKNFEDAVGTTLEVVIESFNGQGEAVLPEIVEMLNSALYIIMMRELEIFDRVKNVADTINHTLANNKSQYLISSDRNYKLITL